MFGPSDPGLQVWYSIYIMYCIHGVDLGSDYVWIWLLQNVFIAMWFRITSSRVPKAIYPLTAEHKHNRWEWQVRPLLLTTNTRFPVLCHLSSAPEWRRLPPPQWAKSALVFSLVALLALLEFRSIKRHSLSKTIRSLGHLRRRIVFDRLRLLTLLQAFLDFPQVRT